MHFRKIGATWINLDAIAWASIDKSDPQLFRVVATMLVPRLAGTGEPITIDFYDDDANTLLFLLEHPERTGPYAATIVTAIPGSKPDVGVADQGK